MVATATSRSPPEPPTTRTSSCCAIASPRRSTAFGPSLLVVSLGLDTFVTDPICDLALTTDGFERCGAAVGELGLPTVVLQEGGYDVAALGENARRWLTGLALQRG